MERKCAELSGNIGNPGLHGTHCNVRPRARVPLDLATPITVVLCVQTKANAAIYPIFLRTTSLAREYCAAWTSFLLEMRDLARLVDRLQK